MNIYVTIFFLILIFVAAISKNHKFLVFLAILSVFADNFRINIGPSLLLINIIAFVELPFIIKYFTNQNLKTEVRTFKILINPIWINFLYLLLLGLFFGFLNPWKDDSNYRIWTQTAQGRTLITIVRYLSEILIAIYFFILIVTKRISLKSIIYTIGVTTFISFVIGIIDYNLGYIFKERFFYMFSELSNRFLALNGEPKMYGRNSALAYIILLFYYLKYEKSRLLLLFIFINLVGVILSLSASSFILFILFNLYLLLTRRNIKVTIFASLMLFVLFLTVQKNVFFVDITKGKIDQALFGVSTPDNSFIENFILRFDIFDHLALLFLYEHPFYLLTGVGPNLISIPASQYVSNFAQYATFAERGGIDSVPNVMLNNVIASSGVVGVILYIIFYVKIYKFASRFDKHGFCKNIVIINLIFNMVYFSVVMLFLSGILIGIIALNAKNKSECEKFNSIH